MNYGSLAVHIKCPVGDTRTSTKSVHKGEEQDQFQENFSVSVVQTKLQTDWSGLVRLAAMSGPAAVEVEGPSHLLGRV